jgi:HSP20 family protein
MLTRWSDLDRTFAALDEFRRRMDNYFDRGHGVPDKGLSANGGWPYLELRDDGNTLLLTAEIPGLGADDVMLTLSQDVLTIAGERKLEVPEGYKLRRQERGSYKFSRSFSLPCPVDPERTTASAKDGVLTIALDKAAEAKPRQITIKSK